MFFTTEPDLAAAYGTRFGAESGYVQVVTDEEMEGVIFYDISTWDRATAFGLFGLARAYAVASRIVVARWHPREAPLRNSRGAMLPNPRVHAIAHGDLPLELRRLWVQDRGGRGVMRFWREMWPARMHAARTTLGV